MRRVLYIHGFLSSPLSFKAQQVKQWLAQHHPDIAFHCPSLTPYPDQTAAALMAELAKHPADQWGVMGSSLGGFWANWLAHTQPLRALVINPAMAPWQFMPAYLDQPLKSYHGDACYLLTKTHLDEIIRYDLPLTHPERIWLLAQTGDATLDYRQAAAYFAGCKQTIEDGGDHSFVGFERFLAPGLEFLFAQPRA